MTERHKLGSTDLKRLHRQWRREATGRLGLALDGVEQPGNVGAIVRTAAAYRVEDLWLAGRTAPVDGRGAQRLAMGTDRYLRCHRTDDAPAAVAQARQAGYHVVALELTDGAEPLHSLSLPDKLCLVVGHEDRGVTKGCLAEVDEVAYLPQLGRVGSLNVAASVAIALYEARRRDWS